LEQPLGTSVGSGDFAKFSLFPFFSVYVSAVAFSTVDERFVSARII
jgi:hypothetical protein